MFFHHIVVLLLLTYHIKNVKTMGTIHEEHYVPNVNEVTCQKESYIEDKIPLSGLGNIDVSEAGVNELKEKNFNVLSFYLKEIGKWPILSRGKEHFLAKTLNESEHVRRAITEKWLILFSKVFNWRTIKKHNQNSSIKVNQKALLLIQSIQDIKDLNKEIKSRERSIANRRLSYYFRKKARREKTRFLMQKCKIIKSIDILQLYKSGIINQLKPFIRPDYPKKAKKELIYILRQLIKYDRQGKKVKDELVRSNLRLVVGIAKKYVNMDQSLHLSDLIQEGNIGLMKAIEKFDYRLGNRLSTYASWWIRQTIIRSIEDKSSIIRIPAYINGKIKKLLKISPKTNDTVKENKRHINDEELLKLQLTLQSIKDPIPLETPFGEDGSNLHECIPDTMFQLPMDQVLKYQLFEDIDEVLKDLPPRDERILRLRFGIGVDSEHTLEEIGEQFGISRERIRQIEQTALKKIKISKKSEILKLILDK